MGGAFRNYKSRLNAPDYPMLSVRGDGRGFFFTNNHLMQTINGNSTVDLGESLLTEMASFLFICCCSVPAIANHVGNGTSFLREGFLFLVFVTPETPLHRFLKIPRSEESWNALIHRSWEGNFETAVVRKSLYKARLASYHCQ